MTTPQDKNEALAQSRSMDGLERDIFDIADSVIEEAYPNIYGLGKGMWGHQHIPNFGILRGAIARAILEERKRSNAKVRGAPSARPLLTAGLGFFNGERT